jgi:hypothetical protein
MIGDRKELRVAFKVTVISIASHTSKAFKLKAKKQFPRSSVSSFLAK